MAINAVHPEYAWQSDAWETMRDCYEGERAVKKKTFRYLKPTMGQVLDNVYTDVKGKGWKAYEAYIDRALFPGNTKEAVESLLGILHRKDAIFEVPTQLIPFTQRMTREGEGFQMLLRRLNTQQLLTGRVGVLLDLPPNPSTQLNPYAAVYDAEMIINWDTDPVVGPQGQRRTTMVVLSEPRLERTDFTWQLVQYYRLLELTPNGTYQQRLFRQEEEIENITPQLQGIPLNKIPFFFLNSKNVVPETDPPPLEGLASLCLAIYRGEADLRQQLHMSAQDTLVVPGGDPTVEYRTGAGAVLCTPGDANPVHYAGVSTQGLGEMRHTLEADKKLAAVRGAQLIDTTSRQRESGDALRIRVAAQTATLLQIALAAGVVMQEILKEVGRWMGLDEATIDGIKVTPNIDFTAETVTGKDMSDIMDAKIKGFPISMQTMWDYARRGGVGERTYEDEQAMIDEEPPLEPPPSNDPTPNDMPPKKAMSGP